MVISPLYPNKQETDTTSYLLFLKNFASDTDAPMSPHHSVQSKHEFVASYERSKDRTMGSDQRIHFSFFLFERPPPEELRGDRDHDNVL